MISRRCHPRLVYVVGGSWGRLLGPSRSATSRHQKASMRAATSITPRSISVKQHLPCGTDRRRAARNPDGKYQQGQQPSQRQVNAFPGRCAGCAGDLWARVVAFQAFHSKRLKPNPPAGPAPLLLHRRRQQRGTAIGSAAALWISDSRLRCPAVCVPVCVW